MNKVTSYLKNVGKSISYASLNVGKSLIPEVSEFTQTNEELFKSIYATVSHSKQSIKYAKKLAKESQLYKDINTGINNVFSDIKTGNFYNKERADQGIESATDSMLGLDELDDFNFDDWDDDDDGSLDDFQDNVPSVDKGDIVIADTVSKSSNLSAQLISKTVASTSNNIIKANMASTNMAMAHNVELVAGIRTSIAGVHESINSLLKFAQETVPAQSNIQSQYFTDSMSIMKENNAILKEMLEMQRNLYNRQREEYKSIDQFSNIFSGGFDLTEYFKAVKNNIKNLDSTGMAGMLGNTMGGSSMLSQMLSNPLGTVVTGLIQSYLPKNVVKDIANFSKTLGGFFPTLIGKLNKWKDDDFGFRSILGKIFGLKVETKKSIDTSKYNKGAVPFDGITRKSIIEVIPGYLSKIESILSGSSQRLYDYETGKWLTAKDIKKKKDDEYAYAVKDSFSEISDDIKTFIKTLEKEKSLKAETKKSLEEDVYKMMEKAFEEGFFSPEDVKENSYKYGFSNSDLMESLAEALSKLPVYKLSSTVGNMAENKRRYGTRQAELESSGHAMSTHLYNDSKLDSHLKFHGKYKDEVIGNTAASNLLNIKDNTGMNVLNYLNQILANLSYIRDYGSLGGSNGKKRKGNKIQSFDDYKKQFDKPYILENIQKLDKDAKNRDEYYEKYNYDKSVDMDDAVLAAIYNVHKKANSDDDDDYKKYGKRYKETNKWQKEMANIPGDTFLEKWHQATSMKEKQILIMGSLSDIAKKPATLLSGMIASAENSIYNFLFKSETDELDSSTGEKIKGFFPAVLNKMRSKWDELTTSIDEKLITPLVQKYGLDEKWNQLKEKLANSKPGEFIRNAKNNISSALRKDIGSGFNYVKTSLTDVAEPIIYNKTFKDIHDKKISKNEELINNNIEGMVNAIDSIKDSSQKAYAKYQLSGRNKAEITRARFKLIREALKNNDLETLKVHLGELSKRELEYFKTKLAQENPEFLEKIKNAGFSKGGVLKVVKDGVLPPYAVSKGETIKIVPNEEREQRKNQEEETNNIIKLITNSIKSNENLQAKIVSTKDKLKAHENDDTLISNFVEGTAKELDNIKNAATETIDKGIKAVVGVEGNTPEEQEKNIKKEKNKILSKVSDVFSEMKGEGARTASKAILGGGIGLLSGVIGGPLIGAGIGTAYSFISSSNTIKDVLFGEEIGEGDDKTRKGGIISKKVQDAFKKYVPDMGKYGVAGGVASFLLPFGPLVGAAVGAGIGLTKNSETMQKMLFGEEGLLNEERKEKIKKYLPKAAIGAAAGMFLGPFGLLGNAAIGAGAGMLTGSEEFRDLIFGEKDANGDRIGGIKGALEEHFIEPIKNFGKNFKDDFFGFIKTSMIDPLNEAITPIANEIAFQTKRVVFGIPKWFLNLGKDYIAVPLLRKLEDTLISPLFDKIIKPMFSGITGTIKGLISLPFRAVGKVGEQTRKHQIRQGRDVVGTAKDRLKFADDKKMGSYKYESFDSKLAEKAGAGDTSWLEELTARTGMLAHGSDYFNKEVKNARKELSKVVSDYYKSGLFNHDKKSYKRIQKYINNNDIELAIQELTEITDSRSSGGSLGSNEAADAISRFNKANKKYQVARDNRDKFGNINEEENATWMEQQFGSDWSKLNSKRLFDYARKESAVAGGKKVSKSDLFKDPTQLITKGEEQITAVLKDIRKILAGDKYTFQDEEKDAEYDKQAEAGKNEAMDIISKRKSSLKNNLSDNNIKVSNNTIDLLYGNKEIYDLVLSANSQGITYDDETIKKLCELDLKSKDIKLLKKFPYAALMPGDKLKKDLNHNRNDYATISKNSIDGARYFRNINLGIDNLAGKINQNLDESTLVKGSEVDKEDSKDYMYQNTNYGLRRYRKDQKGKWTVDLSDSDTKISLQKENEDESRKSSFFNSFSGIKDGVLGLFNRDKEKDKEEKKEPWYKKLFNMDLSGIGGKFKFGALILGGFTAIGALNKFFTENKYGIAIANAVKEVVNPIFTKVGNWFTNQGEYAPDQGISKFLNDHVFPNLFAGMDVFFGKIMPAVVSAFIHNLPTIIKAGVRSALDVLGIGKSKKQESSGDLNPATAVAGGKSVKIGSSKNTSAQWLTNLSSDTDTIANNITSIEYSDSTSKNNKAQKDNKNKENNDISINNNTSDNTNEQVSINGTDVYRKTKNGKLVPVTATDFEDGYIQDLYNEDGSGHWVFNEETGQYNAAEDSDTSLSTGGDIFKRLAYGTSRAALTQTSPLGLTATSKIFKTTGNALGHLGFFGKTIKGVTSIGEKITTGYDKIMKGFSYAGKSFSKNYKAADAASKFSGKNMDKGNKINLSNAANITVDGAKATDTATNVGAKVKKSSKKHNSKILNKVIEFIKEGVTKILNNNTVTKKISEAITESGLKKSVKKVTKELIDKITKTLTKYLVKLDSKIITKIASKITQKLFFWIFIATDFIIGIDQAEAILQIKEPTVLQTLIAGLANVISNLLTFGLISASRIVELVVDFIFPIFSIDTTKYKKQKEEAETETEEYNKQYGEDLSVEEYLKRSESVTGSIFKKLKSDKNKDKKIKTNVNNISTVTSLEYSNTSLTDKQMEYYAQLDEKLDKANKITDLRLGKQYGFTKNGKYIGLEEGVKTFNTNNLNKVNKGEYTFGTVLDTYNEGFRQAAVQASSVTGTTTDISSKPKKNKGIISWVKNLFSGNGTDFVSQVDPRYKNKRFNTSKDTEYQTLGDSGCAPATAANVINLYAGTGTEFDRASKAALKYKEKDSGVTPEYFESYLGNNGINTYPTSNKNKILEGIGAGRPTILLGNDPSNSGKTPYGSASSHYVLATGTDGKGNVIIQDPESKSPNTLYPIDEVLDKSQLGMITGRGSIFDELPKAVTGYYDEKLLDLLGLNPTKEAEVDTSTTSTTDTSYNISSGKLQWPVPSSKTITSPFGYRNHPISGGRKFHSGIDIGASSGKDIIAAEAGTVSKATWYDGYGNCVMINHGNGLVTLYGHCSVLKVKKGQKVKRAQVIAKVGSTGMSTGPHLHFEVQLNGKAVNPLEYVSKSGKGTDTDKKNRKVISIYSGRGLMDDASKNALKYKDINSGVVPEYFENYLGTKNINTHSTTDKNEMVSSIKAGTPTILLGTDHSNSGKTPYGPSSAHYVLATGTDKKGNVIIQDPESSQPNTLYPMDDVIENSQLGMITSQSSGRGRSKVGRKVSQIKNKVNSKLLAGRGKSTSEIEKLVWSRLRGAGYSEIQVAGVMGNIKHESGFNPSVVEKGSGVGFGLCQWSYERRTQIEKYAKSLGKSANDVNVQIEFLIAEMTPGGGANGYAKYQFTKSPVYDGKTYPADTFKNAKDIETATKGFCYCWERPGIPRIDSRIKSAKEYYKKYTGTAASSSSTSDSTSDSSSGLFSAFSKAALSYYDEKLLGLLEFNDNSTTETSSDDSSGEYNGEVSGKAKDVVNVAKAEIGNGGTKYWKYAGFGYRVEWCACFVYWVCCKAGCKSAYGKVGFTVDIPMKYWINRGREVNKTKGQPGDFVSFHNGTNSSYCHIGLIEKNLGNGKYSTIEGNVGGGAGSVKRLTRSSSDIGKIVRPEYSSGKGSGNLDNKTRKYIDNSSYKNKINLVAGRGSVIVKNTGPGSKAAEKIDKEMRKNILNFTNPGEISSNNKSNKTNSTKVESLLTGAGKGTNSSYKIGTLSTYNNYRKSLSGRGSSGYSSLPALSSSSTVSGHYSIGNMPTYNNMSTGSSINIGNSSTEKLLSVIIDVLSIIANNSEKLSQIVELLSKALDLKLTENDISKLSSNNAQIKNKIANALRSQGSTEGMGSSIMTANTESLATAMYSIASA